MTAYEPLVRAFATAVAPLASVLGDARLFARMLGELGWSVPIDGESLEAIRELLPLANSLAALPTTLAQLDDVDEDRVEAVASLVTLVREVIEAIDALQSLDASQLQALPGELADPEAWADIGPALLDLLLVRWLADAAPVLLALLRLTGLCVDEPVGGRVRPRLRWTELANVAGDPETALARTTGWGTELRAWWLQREVALLLARLGLRVRMQPRRPAIAALLAGEPGESASGLDTDLILVSGTSGQSNVEVGVVFAATPEHGGALLFGNLAHGASQQSFELADEWRLNIRGELDGTATIAARLSPDGPSLTGGDAAIDVELALVGSASKPWILFGTEHGPRLELDGASLSCGVSGSVASPELWAEAVVPDQGARLLLDLSEDSFLSDVIGEAPQVSLDLALAWSSRSGWSLCGGAGFEVEVPIARSVGPLYLESFGFALRAGTEGLQTEATITGSVAIGPIAASVEQFGLLLEFSPATQSSGFGGLAASLSFKPPTGAGLAIDVAGVVSGGGFLSRNADTGEYAGILELAMLGVGLTATGLLATRLPGGAEGWSLFFSLAATFTGVQLGFGFTLEGVGGLIGINRGLDERALGEGIRTGALDSILFPEDPIAAAPRILRDIDAIFPIAVGQYVFGPIAKIGWGTPTLLELDVGFVLQLPDPLTISVLGSLSALLPSKDAPIVELHVDVAGTLNLSEGTLRIDASLRDSRVLNLELTGDMAVRSSFRDSPSFLIAFGGFHPDFKPPADFPALQRLGVALDTGDDLRITLRGYLALTSNTVQFGAEFKLRAQAVGFTAKGGASFDALIQFKPFGFVISMKVWVSISAGNIELLGVLLKGKLSGPNPWHAVGEATFKLLGCKKTLEVEAKFGSKANTPPKEAIDVAALLIEELRIDSAWTVLPPEGDGDSGVVLRDTDDSALEVHPAGRIEVRQRIVPLDLRIEQYGNATVAGVDQFTLASPRLGELAIERPEVVSDWFAAAHYFGLDEDEKLSAPSFEQLPAGLRMGDDELEGGDAVDYTYDYELVIRDPKVRSEQRERTKTIVSASRQALQRALQVGRAIAARKSIGLPRSHAAAGVVTVASTSFVVTDASTGARSSATPAAGLSFYAARERARSHDDPRACVLIPAYELELLE